MGIRLVCIFLFIILAEQSGFCQNIAELQNRKNNASREIQYINELLKEAEKEEKSSLNRLQLLNNQIDKRNTLISGIQEEIRLYQILIDNNADVVKWLKEDLDQIKEEYANMIRASYLGRNMLDPLVFLFSADNINQAFRRSVYVKRYSQYRKKQVESIQAIQNLVNEKIGKLQVQRQTREELAGHAQNETRKLIGEKNQQNTIISELQKQQRSLRQKLEQQKKEELQLEREIQLLTERAGAKPDAPGTGYALTPEQILIGDDFEQNRARLPWPVERGVITERFGVYTHPVLTNVQVRNNGINITTEAGANVRAVFNGEVSRVFGIAGGNTAVIIRHGQFLSVYSNLSEVVVKTGDKITAKQTIGTVYTDPDEGNRSVLKFQIWKENQKLDPELWIVRFN